MSGRVVVGVDGSEESVTAVDWAADEAALRGAELRLVNASLWQEHPVVVAVQPARDVRAERARDLLGAMTDRARSRRTSLTTSTEEIEDAPAGVLLSASAHADLVVLGSHGFSAGTGFTAGSVGQAVAAEADSPVVLVRESTPDGDGAVVVGLDILSPGEELLAFAFAFAARRSAPVRVVHTWHLTPLHPHGGGSAAEEAGKEALGEAVRSVRERFPEVKVELVATAGRAAGHLIQAATGSAIVVVGRRRGHALRGHIGAVAHAVIHHAASPVAVVPHT
ncbi:universal stress protein [Streptomyces sp. MUM 2J]|uniref:universal stress protein n=1 Tax=Streptomyces sp. MUM 2J TaxID=2791987 RepID=UPI001F040470|nr:universal stress protein [Streptomyces sp. MUM 2J]MCH0561916.1 universal stress protein [Streptomyces sp. MUM 2J]